MTADEFKEKMKALGWSDEEIAEYTESTHELTPPLEMVYKMFRNFKGDRRIYRLNDDGFIVDD